MTWPLKLPNGCADRQGGPLKKKLAGLGVEAPACHLSLVVKHAQESALRSQTVIASEAKRSSR